MVQTPKIFFWVLQIISRVLQVLISRNNFRFGRKVFTFSVPALKKFEKFDVHQGQMSQNFKWCHIYIVILLVLFVQNYCDTSEIIRLQFTIINLLLGYLWKMLIQEFLTEWDSWFFVGFSTCMIDLKWLRKSYSLVECWIWWK